MDSSSPAQTEETRETRNLSFLQLLKEASRIPVRNIHFTGFILITSLPLLFWMIYFQILLEGFLQDSFKLERPLLSSLDRYLPYYQFYAGIENLSKAFSEKIIFLPLIYLIPLPLLEFLAAYSTIYFTSKIYKNNPNQRLNSTKGILVTSLIIHVLSTALFLGFLWLSIVFNGCNFISYYDLTIIVIHLAGFAIALPKYLELTAMLNSSLVVSVLGDIHGIDALVVSSRFSKGKEKLGCNLMMVFFVWGFVLRIPCIFFDDGNVGIFVRSTLLWLGCLMKWVVCVVYCYECMGVVLEKRMAGGSCGQEDEEGKLTASLLKDGL
ncbi:hypothetical protein RND81_07G192600 [Saponaria officinalis]